MLRIINLGRNSFLLILSIILSIFFVYLDIYIFLVVRLLSQYIALTISIGILSVIATIIFLAMTLLLTYHQYQYRRLDQVSLIPPVNVSQLINTDNYSDEWYEEINSDHI